MPVQEIANKTIQFSLFHCHWGSFSSSLTTSWDSSFIIGGPNKIEARKRHLKPLTDPKSCQLLLSLRFSAHLVTKSSNILQVIQSGLVIAPHWRSLNPLKRSRFHHPKKGHGLNHQGGHETLKQLANQSGDLMCFQGKTPRPWQSLWDVEQKKRSCFVCFIQMGKINPSKIEGGRDRIPNGTPKIICKLLLRSSVFTWMSMEVSN